MAEETKDQEFQEWRKEVLIREEQEEADNVTWDTCIECERKYKINEDGCGSLYDNTAMLTYCGTCFPQIKQQLDNVDGDFNMKENDQEDKSEKEFQSDEEVCNHLIVINVPNQEYTSSWKGLEYYLLQKSALKSRTNLFRCNLLMQPMLYW